MPTSRRSSRRPDQAGHDDHDRRWASRAIDDGGHGREGQDQGQGRQGRRAATSATCIVAVGIVPNTENVGLETLARDGPRLHPDRSLRPHQVPRACGRSAIARRARGWRTRRATRASPPPRRSRRNWATRTCTRIRSTASNIPGCTYCHPQVASRRPDRGQGQGSRPRGQGRQVPLHRQRQGDRAGRDRGLHQDGVRRQDRRIARRAHDRRRGDRADPGLYGRQDRRD